MEFSVISIEIDRHSNMCRVWLSSPLEIDVKGVAFTRPYVCKEDELTSAPVTTLVEALLRIEEIREFVLWPGEMAVTKWPNTSWGDILPSIAEVIEAYHRSHDVVLS